MLFRVARDGASKLPPTDVRSRSHEVEAAEDGSIRRIMIIDAGHVAGPLGQDRTARSKAKEASCLTSVQA